MMPKNDWIEERRRIFLINDKKAFYNKVASWWFILYALFMEYILKYISIFVPVPYNVYINLFLLIGIPIIITKIEKELIYPDSDEIIYYLYRLSENINKLEDSPISKDEIKNNLKKLDEILNSVELSDELFTTRIEDVLNNLHSSLKKTNTYIDQSVNARSYKQLSKHIENIAESMRKNSDEITKDTENKIRILNSFFVKTKESEINPTIYDIFLNKLKFLWEKPIFKYVIIIASVFIVIWFIPKYIGINLSDFEKITVSLSILTLLILIKK